MSGTGAVRRNGAHHEFREKGGVRPKNMWMVSGGGGVGIVFKASGGFCRRDVMTELVLEDSLTVVQDRSEGTRVERRQQVGGDRNSVDER